jgi:hypothetical protein
MTTQPKISDAAVEAAIKAHQKEKSRWSTGTHHAGVCQVGRRDDDGATEIWDVPSPNCANEQRDFAAMRAALEAAEAAR